MFLRQATASQEILLGPFVDDADGKTAETALTIAASDVKLWKGGTTEADKNSGGATHVASGRYSTVLDATDTDTVGMLEVNVAVAGALPVRRQFYVLEEAVFDAIFAANSQGFLRPTVAGRTLDVSLGGEAGIDWANIGSPAATQAFSDTTVAYLSSGGIDRIWQALTGTMTTVGSIGKKLADVVFNWNTTTPPTVEAIRTEIDSNSTQLAKLGTPTSTTLAADIAAVKGETATAAAEVVKIPRRTSAIAAGAAVTKTNTSVTPNQTLTEVLS